MGQGQFLFVYIPTEDEIVAKSALGAGQIDLQIAKQIVFIASRWTPNDPEKRIQLLNFMCNQVEQRGSETWPELRWSILMNRINQLSVQINDQVDELSERHGLRREADDATSPSINALFSNNSGSKSAKA